MLRSCVHLSIAIMSQLQVWWYLKSMYNCIFCVAAVKNCMIYYEMFMVVIIVLFWLLLCVFVCTRGRIVEVESASLSRPDWSFLRPLSAASCFSIVQVRNIAATKLCKYVTLSATRVYKYATLLLLKCTSTQHSVLLKYTSTQHSAAPQYLPSFTASLLLWPSDQV